MANTSPIDIQYPYQPLEKICFRLLHILPGTKPDRIECKLVGGCLDHSPVYEALSYSWGRSTDQHYTIWLDKVPVQVRESLFQALLHLRRPRHTRIFWVDAICINQSDLAERASGIHQMARIYSQAEQVTVWVGGASSDSSLAVRFIQKIAAKIISDGPETNPDGYKYVVDRFIVNPYNSAEWVAMAHLCGRLYWKRRWIIQEIALAGACVIQCGSEILDWKSFELVCLELAKPNVLAPDRPDPASVAAIRRSLAIKVAMLRSRHRHTYDLQSLLEEFEESDCKESRDKIYAMFALIEASPYESLVADYDKALFEVYVDVIRFLLPFYVSKTPEGPRKLNFAKSIVRISQAVQRNLGDVSAGIDEETLEVISESFSLSNPTVKGAFLIQGIKGDTIAHLRPYMEGLCPEAMMAEFKDITRLGEDLDDKQLALKPMLLNGLSKFDKADKKRVVSFDSRKSYGTIGWSPSAYIPRADPAAMGESIFTNPRTRNTRRRSSLNVRPDTEVQVFIGDSGVVGIAPAAAKVGDSIYHFLNCDAAAVIRPHGGTFLFVGRALVFPREGSASMRLNDHSHKMFKYFVPNERDLSSRTNRLSFYTDVATLQLLTR